MIYPENFIQGNHSEGIEIIPSGIVLHHNNLIKEELIRQCTEPKEFTNRQGLIVPPASYHCFGWKDGSRTTFCKDNQRAWHSGHSAWNGRKWCNNFMLSYSFHGDTNKEPLTNEQVFSFTEWLILRIEAWKIQFNNITDHRTVSPGRKVDLNPYELLKIQTHIKYLFDD